MLHVDDVFAAVSVEKVSILGSIASLFGLVIDESRSVTIMTSLLRSINEAFSLDRLLLSSSFIYLCLINDTPTKFESKRGMPSC